MCTYNAFMCDETLEEFFSDCPFEIDKKGVIEMFTSNIKQTFKKTKRELQRVAPTVDEFIALFGLALWNGHMSLLSSKIAQLVTKNRQSIICELSKVYTRNGVNDHASRI
ncbi:hypothetical protein PMAYCL1PPCAC_22289 [Pristionchus mayeri]|uniref:NR LBD domain-containing protein n=1 Tax=Pristionchus mayeri TaxID=1317129 RepID=A0AAN5I5E4_9BILA|nr:hypothetical protein PMAYCL1PPCAC_22289 [Pristionchus mayeri]